ncbi:MAG: HD domain-containing protein [bacterium]|nr:HD domain-containing protein [bacterium]
MAVDWVRRAREAVAGKYGPILPHVEAVVAHAGDLATHYPQADREVVVVAAWLHDLARVEGEADGHATRGAELAREFLAAAGYPPARANLVAWAILHHTDPVYGPERGELPLEARILYDADKMDRVRGYYLAELLVTVGTRVAGEGGHWLAHLPSARELYVGLFESLYTERAREAVQADYEACLDFLDRVTLATGRREGR